MKRLMLLLIRFYQRVLSPMKRQPTCRFTPTCSSYAIEAIEKRGFLIGTVMMVDRIVRCNPFCPGGYDPVPDKGLRNPRNRAYPMTKYYYPDEYDLLRAEEDTPQDAPQ